ncbi:hypothetical protein F5888DRAFT_1632908 [Russula emetica]|nr:hypothetical protein F5888DRAFT_1632908 [Russula emetica]
MQNLMDVCTGNTAILKGGKEYTHTAAELAHTIQAALAHTTLPGSFIQTVKMCTKVNALLSQDQYIDLVIPCGSNALITPSLVTNLPPDHYIDTPVAPQPRRSTASPFTDPFEPQRISLPTPASQSNFGSLNVSGNGLFSSNGMPDPTTTTSATFPPPSFCFDSESAPVDPYSILDHITPSQSPALGDYLHPPSFNLMQQQTSVSAEPISVDSENHQLLPVYPKTKDQLH